MLKKLITSIVTLLIFTISMGAAALDLKKAKQFYDQAEKHYDKSQFKEALTLYEKAFDLSKKYEMYFSIAQCQRHLKNYERAIFFYKRFLSKFPTSVYKDEVVKQIAACEKAIQDQAAKAKIMGRISVITKPEGAQVLVDTFNGTPEGVSPVVIYVTPGTHLIVLKKDGHQTKTQKITVAKGEMKFFEINLDGAGKVPAKGPKKDPVLMPKDLKKDAKKNAKENADIKPSPSAATAATPFYKKWWFYVGTAGTVAGLGLMAYGGITALDKQSAYDDEKAKTSPNQNELDRLKSDGEDAAMLSDIGLGVAVFSATATVLAIIFSDGEKSSASGDDPTDGSTAKSFTLIPACGGSFCGLNATFRF